MHSQAFEHIYGVENMVKNYKRKQKQKKKNWEKELFLGSLNRANK